MVDFDRFFLRIQFNQEEVAMKRNVLLNWAMLCHLAWIIVGLATPGAFAQTSQPREQPGPVVASVPGQSDAGERMHVTFINPGISDSNNPTGTFWLSVSAFMQAAADDLAIDLEIIYSERNHLQMQRQARDVALRPDPPDFVIVVNEKVAADEMVKILDQAGIKVFVILNTFVGDQATAMGPPRQKYPHWIGSLIPDNQMAGAMIAKRVIKKAMQAGLYGQDGKIHLVAIAGDHATPAAIARNVGLGNAVQECGDVKMEQMFVGEWNKDKAKYQAQGALQRYPEVSAIWAANDPMALGAMDAVREAGKTPGKDIMIGGLNWDGPALDHVRNGGMATSVGGHFMTGAWALVLLYDYNHSKDFAVPGPELQYQIFSALDHENVGQYLQQFGKGDWRGIDFKKFSKVLNPDVADYQFDLDALFRNLEKR